MKQNGLLAPLPDVARIRVRSGQVLVYPRHTPPGVFVALTGTLCRFADGTQAEAGCGDRWDAAAGPFAIPSPDEMAEPAHAGVAVDAEADLLFVPRSVVLSRDDVEAILAAAGIAVVSLSDALTSRRTR